MPLESRVPRIIFISPFCHHHFVSDAKLLLVPLQARGACSYIRGGKACIHTSSSQGRGAEFSAVSFGGFIVHTPDAVHIFWPDASVPDSFRFNIPINPKLSCNPTAIKKTMKVLVIRLRRRMQACGGLCAAEPSISACGGGPLPFSQRRT